MKYCLFILGLLSATIVQAQDLVLEEIPLEAPHPEITQDTKLSDTDVSTQTPQASFSLQKSISYDDLYTLLDSQTKTLQELTARLEQAEHNLKMTEEKLERINQDIAFRLTELENKANTAPVVIDKNSDKERYDYAYSLLKDQKYLQAETEFLSFIKDFESSPFLPNALYWLGETYYTQQQFEKSVGPFADVFTKHQTSHKAPDALLKMGLAMIALDKKTEACTAFIALPNEYPKAEQSLLNRAKEEAQKNQCL